MKQAVGQLRVSGGDRRHAGGRTSLRRADVSLTHPCPSPAFTLIELVIVMALLATLLAVVAPSLSRTMRQRNLEEQATRLLALTEYGRDEATSQGVPILVWINPDSRRFGIDVKSGFDASTVRTKDYTLPDDLGFVAPDGAVASKVEEHGFNVAEFAPDGTLDPASVAALSIVDQRHAQTLSLTQTTDGYGYEIIKPGGATQP